MKSKAKTPSLRPLSLAIGDFIRYWGFRRIHGAVWAQLYVSKKPLSCTDLARELGLSKALVSPALDELVGHGLIREADSPNDKTKLYIAVENVNEVIRDVLKKREAVLLRKISKDFENFQKSASGSEGVDPQRVEALGEMIGSATFMLDLMTESKDLLNLPFEIQS